MKNVVLDQALMQSHSAEFLEALTTVIHFIRTDGDYSHDSLVQKVKEIKPHLSARIVSTCVNIAKEFLLKNEPVDASLEEEMTEWERVQDLVDDGTDASPAGEIQEP